MTPTFEERLAHAEALAAARRDLWREAVEARKVAQAREKDAEHDWDVARQAVASLMREELAARSKGGAS